MPRFASVSEATCLRICWAASFVSSNVPCVSKTRFLHTRRYLFALLFSEHFYRECHAKVSLDELTVSGWTDSESRNLYSSYDVTDLLDWSGESEQVLGIAVGTGWRDLVAFPRRDFEPIGARFSRRPSYHLAVFLPRRMLRLRSLFRVNLTPFARASG